MMNRILERLREPSTFAGLSAITLGLGEVARINEAPAVASTIAHAGEQAITGNFIGAGVALFTGLFAIFMKEKSR